MSTTEAKESRTGLQRLPGTGTAAAMQSAKADAVITRNGRLQRVWERVRLSEKAGDIYTIDEGKTFMLQADAYYKVMGVAGMQIVEAPMVPVHGKEEPNPYVRQNSDGRITGIYIKAAMIGRNAIGTQEIVTETLFFDPETWFKLALVKLCYTAKGSGAWSDGARMVATDSIDRGQLHESEVPYPIDEFTSVIVDMRNYKVRNVLQNRVAVQRDATKRARTVLARRLARAHPGLPGQKIPGSLVKSEGGDNVIDMPVMGWIDMEEEGATARIAKAVRKNAQISEEYFERNLGVSDMESENEDLQRIEAADASDANRHMVETATAVVRALRAIDSSEADELLSFANVETELSDCSDAQLQNLIEGGQDAIARHKATAKKGGAS